MNLDTCSSSTGHDGHDHCGEAAGNHDFWTSPRMLASLSSGVFLALGIYVEFFLSQLAVAVPYLGPVSVAHCLFAMAVITGSLFTVRQGLSALFTLRMSVDFLITVALVGAMIIGEWLEAGSLAFLYGVAELMEDYAMITARGSLRELMELSPDRTRVRRDGEVREVETESVNRDDRVITRPGEKIPLDGQVVEGQTRVNESPVTGESMAVKKQPGDSVFAGTLNEEGYIEFDVTDPAGETTLDQMVRLIEEAEASRAPAQRFVDRFTSYYTPAVVGAALITGIVIPMLPGVAGGFESWWLKAMALLVIACPCGLLISTPVSVVSAITSAARHGVLIKGGEPFEWMGQVDVICFDKTGTLTTGKPVVTDVFPTDGRRPDDVVYYAVSLETQSEHHLAGAIVSHAADEGIEPARPDSFQAVPGRGVRGTVNGKSVRVGRIDWFSNGDAADGQRDHPGQTAVGVEVEGELIGRILLEDSLRPEARKTVEALKQRGIKPVMITGDRSAVAEPIARKLGITDWRGDCLPEDKVEEITRLRSEYGRVAMVGDGINDAPAMAASDVGIAMGVAGTDTALETAEIALMGDRLSRLIYLVDLSRKGEAVIQQNIYASIIVKLVLALGVIPGWVNLITAVLVGDMGVAFGVTANAMRLRGVTDDSSEPQDEN